VIIKKKLIIPKITNKIDKNLLKQLNMTFSQKFMNHEPAKRLIRRNKVYDPVFKELFFLHNLITLNKRLTILEIGSGWSTMFLYHALKQNRKKYENQTRLLRGMNKFEIFVLENDKKYFKITKKKLEKISEKNTKINWCYSDVVMSQFEGRYCTVYKSFPKVNPDFIYLDGPDIFKVKGKINNFDANHGDFMPMVSDLLRIEFYLIPGTIIVVDGRAANVQFLQSFFKRKWLYYYVKDIDKHIFFLDAKSLGLANDLTLNFYGKKND